MNNLIEAVSNYVKLFLEENLSDQIKFHTIEHTKMVVNAVKAIGIHENLPVHEMETVIISAWFHDCGYAKTYIRHEDESKKIAKSFLGKFGCESYFIDTVLKCIDATKYPQNPLCLVEKILCDADMYHLTSPNYPKYEKALRQEFEKYLGLIYNDENWKIKNCNFFREHVYHTEYGQKVLSRFKEVNLKLMNCQK
ncbi:HD domain-containing protein [Chryseobacterium sp. PBS4-4]|uniref:HD domain-containing protein n=1 Tax=Chryseobacterium edaphi TaxID=2976532 RepID=A0ABT2W353_9FLAO|nr:HD domain-containing protein [Chryseobacterium edaphi]MCU7616642.1 HD domain-containing protein [Chryseobacterium edaphi]